jgi:hypothetical protein
VPPRSSNNRFSSPLVALFVKRSGIDSSVPEQILYALINRAAGPRTSTLDQRIHRLLQSRRVGRQELIDDLDCDGMLEPAGQTFQDGFVVRLKRNSPSARRRFTLAHELCHTFFYELVPEIKYAAHVADEEEERLCNAGAAAILIPEHQLRRNTKGLEPSLNALDRLSAEFEVSPASMMVRLRSLGVWTCELSRWRRMSDGRFALDTFYGGRRQDWQWQDAELLDRAWVSRVPLRGRMFVNCRDSEGITRYRSIAYEVRRDPGAITALWGASLKTDRNTLPLLAK